jgi:hypothetical protein
LRADVAEVDPDLAHDGDDLRVHARAGLRAGGDRACFAGSASAANNAAAICERPALWTHAKSTVVMAESYQATRPVA